jgi:hypothetical protein
MNGEANVIDDILISDIEIPIPVLGVGKNVSKLGLGAV